MSKFVPISGPIVADTVYADGNLLARDVAFTLPEVAPMTAELSAMGTFELPIWQLIEQMDLTVTKIGLDMGLRSAITPDMKPFEFRWVQTVTDANGNTKNVGVKAFIKGVALNLPEIGLEVGSASEHELRFSVIRYNLFVDGAEMWLIDRLAGKVRINGKDYADLDSML